MLKHKFLSSWEILNTVLQRALSGVLQGTKECSTDDILPRSEQCLKTIYNLTDLSPINQASGIERFIHSAYYISKAKDLACISCLKLSSEVKVLCDQINNSQQVLLLTINLLNFLNGIIHHPFLGTLHYHF